MSFHLYIKCAELSHNLEYIKGALFSYGVVKDVVFIEKENVNNKNKNVKKYNGVIVFMDSWKSGNHVDKLLQINKQILQIYLQILTNKYC
jgi:hypothetical protein